VNFEYPILLAALGLVVVAMFWAVRHFLAPEARLERRRRRSNSRIASNAKHPSVKFSVRTKKD
jgi:hypothetical protein